MRIVVTGASGFIGKELCYKLLERGHEVVGLCRTSGALGAAYPESFRHIPYVMGAVLPEEVLRFAPAALVHLAWDGIPDFSERRCVDNVESQLRFLKETENLGQMKKMVGAGTCREYGAKQGACAESDRVPPDSYFSWAKQTLAEYLRLMCQQQQISLVWFRIFYIYGPGQRAESLIPTLIQAFKSKQNPEIKNPSAANDFIHIDDVVSAFVKAIEDEDCQGTFNLGSGKTTPVAKIAEMVEQTIRKDSQFSTQLAIKLDGGKSNSGMWADTTLSGRHLGWTPQISLVDGIGRTYRSTVT